jgi:DNA (cytosine-5)-methyltransferase 1
MSTLKAIDFFCGAGGMSFGLQKAGVKILGGIDNDSNCKETYEKNIKGGKFIKRNLVHLSATELGRRLGLKRNDPELIFAGCSPCQYWTKIRTDRTKSAKSAFLLKNFQRFIKYFRPGFVVVENVPGLLKNSSESILPDFLNFLEAHGYTYAHGLINAHDYDVPQNRVRYLLIASRVTETVTLPEKSNNARLTVRDAISATNGFRCITAGHTDPTDFQHSTFGMTAINVRRIRATPRSGGNRASWGKIKGLQIPAYEGKDEIFRDVYSRMYWDRPAPTITTKFVSFSNGRFGHPTQSRAISIREGATLQSFPHTFVFEGSGIMNLARQIGNAVPPNLAYSIGRKIARLAQNGEV